MAVFKEAHSDMEKLVDIFLATDFVVHDGESNDDGGEDDLRYEGEVVGEPGSPEVKHLDPVFIRDERFLKACGHKLAKMGDDFLHHRTTSGPSMDSGLRSSFQRASGSKDTESEAWESFKGYLEQSLQESDGKDAYRTLGAVLLVAKGLTTLGGGVSKLARKFTMRFITERGLDSDIQRMGGLEGVYAHNLD